MSVKSNCTVILRCLSKLLRFFWWYTYFTCQKQQNHNSWYCQQHTDTLVLWWWVGLLGSVTFMIFAVLVCYSLLRTMMLDGLLKTDDWNMPIHCGQLKIVAQDRIMSVWYDHHCVLLLSSAVFLDPEGSLSAMMVVFLVGLLLPVFDKCLRLC